MPYEVQIKRVEAQPTAIVRRLAKAPQLPQVLPQACGEVWNFIRATNLPHTGHNMALYLDGEMNIECGVIVRGPFQGDGNVISSTIPAGLVATAAHFGPYHLLGGAHGAVLDWCKAQGHRLAGPSWEIYGHWSDDPAQLRTDVFWLLVEGSESTPAQP